jgi:chaperone modulatory protein CbpM
MPEFVIETEFFTETEVLVALPRLTPPRLTAFVASGVVLPLTVASGTGAGLAFRRIDLARLELLCELVEEFDLDDDGLGLVIRLVDQLHATRRDLNRLCAAVAEEDLEVRRRLSKKLAPTE